MADHVFISYSHEDKEFVLALAARLRERGISVWIDQWSIPTWDASLCNLGRDTT
jgi:hypothetical protein